MASTMTSSSKKQQQKRRAKPGSMGEGDYYRIELRPSNDFTFFRNHDVGDKGHLIRVAGKRTSGSWDTVAWLVSKEDAHIEGETLIVDSEDAKQLIESLGTKQNMSKGISSKQRIDPISPRRKNPPRLRRKPGRKISKKPKQPAGRIRKSKGPSSSLPKKRKIEGCKQRFFMEADI